MFKLNKTQYVRVIAKFARTDDGLGNNLWADKGKGWRPFLGNGGRTTFDFITFEDDCPDFCCFCMCFVAARLK